MIPISISIRPFNKNIDIDNGILQNIDIDKAILKNIDIDIVEEILENIDIDEIGNQLEFGISNRARVVDAVFRCGGVFNI